MLSKQPVAASTRFHDVADTSADFASMDLDASSSACAMKSRMELDNEMIDLTAVMQGANIAGTEVASNEAESYIPACGRARRRIERNLFDLSRLTHIFEKAKLSAGAGSEHDTVDEEKSFQELGQARLMRGPHCSMQNSVRVIASTVDPTLMMDDVLGQASALGRTFSANAQAPQVFDSVLASENDFFAATFTLEQAEG